MFLYDHINLVVVGKSSDLCLKLFNKEKPVEDLRNDQSFNFCLKRNITNKKPWRSWHLGG